ncbi:golgin subfamily A member 5 [Neocloeon triangulifer]|uniref:golgin subfamily A member 5 n=1 Tax=Neocloeon triangulifer TaxID=2078957 RepID=UPI00286EF597|nr:golgin subfamily A member 5 [Neocloeon triangulifer]XP_059487496.1 golgin subfamily A member 5 [Neocloeon triangulifer]
MSETDDTDVLVLIPHDFFTVSSSSEDDQHRSRSHTKRARFYSKMSQDRSKPGSTGDLSKMLSSADNTPQKNVPPSSLYYKPEEPSSASGPRYSADFTSNLMAKSNGFDSSKFRRSTSDLPTMGDTPKQGEPNKEETREPTSPQSHPYVCGDNIGSVPDLGFGLRAFLASLGPPQHHCKTHSQDSPSRLPVHEDPCTKKYYYSVGGSENASALAAAKRQLEFDDSSPVRGSAEKMGSYMKRPSAFVPVSAEAVPRVADLQRGSSPGTPLPSLSQMWRDSEVQPLGPSEPSQQGPVDPLLLSQKLEEEVYKRMHCEQVIGDLQQKLLRESERVAVATQVDARKDDYLSKLRTRYEGTARQWQTERERMLLELTEKHEMCSATIQRLRNCEKELSKALDLASGFQQRALSLERDKAEFDSVAKAKEAALERECRSLEQEVLKLRAAAEISDRHENKRSDQLASLQNTLDDERKERLALETQYKRDESLILEAKDLRQKVDSLQQSLDDARSKEKTARQEIKELTQAMEQSRSTLKEQYQSQLDQVVRSKLSEFQTQLDQAEAAIRNQWENKEAEMAAKHAKVLSEMEQRHLNELKQVEERHTRDVGWWKRSLAKAMEQIQELTSELEKQEKHKEQLASKMRSLLQSQYQQATTLIWEQPTSSADSKVHDTRSWLSNDMPVTSSVNESRTEQDQLKKYIEMLLTRPVGDPLMQDSDSQSLRRERPSGSFAAELDLSKLTLNDKNKSSKDTSQKPPWKPA